MQRIGTQLELVAKSDFSILIEGETGVGKSFLARMIHLLSKRANDRFLPVDIAAIPETLIESELFGYVRGAFTGADRAKRGFFELGNKGTIFLDEIENIPPYAQSKILRAVEEKEIFPLGGSEAIQLDFRLVCATNRNIRKDVQESRFREDLYYRLNEFSITIPPLRERLGDLEDLAYLFMLEAAQELEKTVVGISDDALNAMGHYHWPGNIRELKNVVRRGVLLCPKDMIDAKTLHGMMVSESIIKSEPLMEEPLKGFSIKDAEHQAIIRALEKTGGRRVKAAELLEIDYKTLLNKIKKYQIEV